jgi:hypothetical protein
VHSIKLIRDLITTLETAPTQPAAKPTVDRPTTARPQSGSTNPSDRSASSGGPVHTRPDERGGLTAQSEDEVVAAAIRRVEAESKAEKEAVLAAAAHAVAVAQAQTAAEIQEQEAEDEEDEIRLPPRDSATDIMPNSPERTSKPFSSGFDGTIDIRSSLLNEVSVDCATDLMFGY